ncbi:MAG: hypothetical protein WC506_06155 [Candidatus Micrarchaeia archaeon]
MKSGKIIFLFAILSMAMLFLGCAQQPPAPPASNQTQAMNNSTSIPSNLPPLEITLAAVPDISNSTPLYIEGRVSRDARVTLNQKALEVSNGSFSAYLGLAEGQNRFVFEATDSYGNKNTLVKVVRYNTSTLNGSNSSSLPPYVPENGTVAEKSIPVSITVTNETAFLGFNVSEGSDVLGLGTISEGKSSARKVILSNEEDSAVYVHFNGTGNISDFFVYPEPFTMYSLGETHEIWIKALIPLNTSLGTYEGTFLIQEIRESPAAASGGNSSQNQ